MKILLITHEFYPQLGGVANVLTNLYRFYQEENDNLYILNPFTSNHNVFKKVIVKNYNITNFISFLRKRKFYVFTFLSFWKILEDSTLRLSDRLKLILYFFTKPKVFLKVIDNIINLYPFLNKIDFDLIVSGHSGWILPLSFTLSRIFRKKIISIAYGLDFLVKFRYSFKTYYFRNLEKIIVITNQTKQLIKKIHHLTEEQVEVVYVGINTKELELKTSKVELRDEFSIPQDTFVLLSVGRQVPRKNFQLVIQAVSQIIKTHPKLNFQYILIGEGSETKNLKKIVKQEKIEDFVKFKGSCDALTRNKYYKLSDVFVMPSIAIKNDIEGFGIVFLEANYYKVPVIGTKSGGIVEAIIDGKTGYLIEPNNLNELIEKILLLHGDIRLRKSLGEFGYSRVINEFSWEKIIKDYKRIFRSI